MRHKRVPFYLPHSAALVNICFFSFISESLQSKPELVLNAPDLDCLGTFYKFSCGRTWAVCATKFTHELMESVENWLILHGAKGMQESVNILCLFFLLPSKFLPVLAGEKLSAVWPGLMIPASTCNATSTYMCEIPLSLFLLNTLPEQGLGLSLMVQAEQTLRTGSCSAPHLPSLPDSSRLAGACGR